MSATVWIGVPSTLDDRVAVLQLLDARRNWRCTSLVGDVERTRRSLDLTPAPGTIWRLVAEP